MGRPKKNFYEGDEGLAIQNWMKDLDWEDRPSQRRAHETDGTYPPDQEDDDWEEKLYERGDL